MGSANRLVESEDLALITTARSLSPFHLYCPVGRDFALNLQGDCLDFV